MYEDTIKLHKVRQSKDAFGWILKCVKVEKYWAVKITIMRRIGWQGIRAMHPYIFSKSFWPNGKDPEQKVEIEARLVAVQYRKNYIINNSIMIHKLASMTLIQAYLRSIWYLGMMMAKHLTKYLKEDFVSPHEENGKQNHFCRHNRPLRADQTNQCIWEVLFVTFMHMEHSYHVDTNVRNMANKHDREMHLLIRTSILRDFSRRKEQLRPKCSCV